MNHYHDNTDGSGGCCRISVCIFEKTVQTDNFASYESTRDQPVPEEMDGRAHSEMFAEAHQRAHPVAFSTTEETVESEVEKGPIYSDQEEDEITERLRGPGYIE